MSGSFAASAPREQLGDPEKERQRLSRDLAKVDKDLQKLRAKLDNPKFLEKAPAEVVEKDRARKDELDRKREQLQAKLDALS